MNVGLVLKEIEMPPCSRCGVVSGKTFSTGFLRTRKPSSTLKSDVNVKFQGRFFRWFELHLRYVPRRWKIQSNSKQIYSIHDQTAFLVLSSWIQFYRSEFRFSSVTHSKQRKAIFFDRLGINLSADRSHCICNLFRGKRTAYARKHKAQDVLQHHDIRDSFAGHNILDDDGVIYSFQIVANCIWIVFQRQCVGK